MSLKRQESFHKLGQLLPVPALCTSSLALWHRCAAAGKGPSMARLLQVGRLTPKVWSWAGDHCISVAKQSLLHCQRPAGDDCLLPETKILQYTFSSSILIASRVMGLIQARSFLLCHRWNRGMLGLARSGWLCGQGTVLWGKAKGREAALKGSRFGSKGQCKAKVDREHPGQRMVHLQ